MGNNSQPSAPSGTVDVDGVRMHYLRSGTGPTMVLLHGFPQDSYEWRAVMTRLAATYTTIAVDLRGVGGSDAPAEGYDAATLAADVHGVVEALGLGPVHVVGHDVGGWVAYAYARAYAAQTTSATIIETLIPGTARFVNPDVEVGLWHAQFHMVPGLPEKLVSGRQADYFRYFFDVGTRGAGVITEADIAHYAAAYGDDARLHAAFEVYRAVPQNIWHNVDRRDPIDVPLTLVGGEHVFGQALVDTAAELRNDFGWRDVRAEVLVDGQHYVVEERPDDVAAILARRIGQSSAPYSSNQ
jgi:pimeloyl-ACP methyl ester carboxylesterase